MKARANPNWRELSARHPAGAVNLFRGLARTGGRIESSRLALLGRAGCKGEELDAMLGELIALSWLTKRERSICPCCQQPLEEPLPDDGLCPRCHRALVDCDGPATEVIYLHEAPPPRIVDWVLTLHGMNTLGAWQEKLAWLIARTYGRAIPVAVYKYGVVRPGVLFRWRHRQLRDQVAERLRALSAEAGAAGYRPQPDVIAHSFGTLLLAQALTADETLQVGRVILAGSILPPDFEWQPLIDRGQVEAVLNFYGTADFPVAVTHYLIPDSGPAGRRGFDKAGVVNVEAAGFGHSTVFGERLDSVFDSTWKPFLQAADPDAAEIPHCKDPERRWKESLWGLRAGIARLVAILILGALTLFLVGSLTFGAWPFLRFVGRLF